MIPTNVPNLPHRTPWWQKLLLMSGGVGLALGLLTLLLRLFPQLIPNADRAARVYASVTMEAEFHTNDGDMFAWLPGKVRAPAENVMLAKYTLAWDADGFRMPAQVAPAYPIAVVGDSFTEGANVPLPYPDVLADLLATPVRNYGYRGYGPIEIEQAARAFLPQERRTWVLYGHFSGNDLLQVKARADQLVSDRNAVLMIPFLARRAAENVGSAVAQIDNDPNKHYDFPMPVIIGGNYYELALLDSYLWWQRAPAEGFAASQSYAKLGAILDQIASVLDPATCRAFIFIPTSGQLYYPYLVDGRRWLRQIALRPTRDAAGWLDLAPAPYSEAEEPAVIAALDDQRDAMRQLAAERGWLFIDLLEPFQQRVAQGELLYYAYDTHWNQAGHRLAAEVIATFMQNTPNCPLQ